MTARAGIIAFYLAAVAAGVWFGNAFFDAVAR